MSFILPTAVVRIIDFVGLNEDNQIVFNSDNNNYALCKTLENDIILVRFLTNLKKIEIDQSILEDFFKKKASNGIKQNIVLKVSKALGQNKEKKKEKTVELQKIIKQESPDLDDTSVMMEVVERLSTSFDEEAKQIILNDKTISKNSVIRIPLSSNKKEKAFISNKEVPIYESFSLLMTKDRNPKDSGIYLFSSNKHSIPLIFEKNKNGKYNVRFNGEFANKEILINLLNHSLRTYEHKKGYMLTIFITKKDKERHPNLNNIVENINRCSKSESYAKEYPELISELIRWIEDNENEKILVFRNSYIYLPKQLDEENIFHGTLFDNLTAALLNVSLRKLKYENKEEILEKIHNMKNAFFKNKKFYGFYNILYTIPNEDSDTYGFLENNIHPHQIMTNFNDTLEFYNYLIDIYKDELKVSNINSEEPVLLDF